VADVGAGVESTTAETSDEFDRPMTVVDAHLHLWELERSAYEWITP
jgi:hypothetical protein